jgi:hypothetical protein
VAGVAAVFETGAALLTVVRLELTTTAVFDLPAVFAVELFAVVLAVLLQAEMSNANEAMLSFEKVVIFMISFSHEEADFSISRDDFEEQMDCMFNVEFQSSVLQSVRNNLDDGSAHALSLN